jgi:TPP-dependent pyruvate/acetoin dehydrogenase alpha subunit
MLIRGNRLNGSEYETGGGEAAAAGVVIDLLPEDTVMAFPNDILPFFIKGSPLEKLFVQRSTECAEQLKLAIGAAVACKAHKDNKIVVIFLSGDGMKHGSWEEALKVAGVDSLPILFVSQGALTPEPQSNGGRSRLKDKAYGFPAIAVEGNDAVAVYRVASEAIAHARKGDGPTLIECQCTQAGDALLNMENYLIRKGLFSEQFKRQAEIGFLGELDDAMEMSEKISRRG